MQPVSENAKYMTRKELICQLAENHSEQNIKLLRNFPTLLRDLYMMEDYDEIYAVYKRKGIHALKESSRDFILDRYGIGINQFYALRKRVEWILAKAN